MRKLGIIVLAAMAAAVLAGCTVGTTLPPSSVTTGAATLNGQVTPDGDSLSWSFQYRKQGAAAWKRQPAHAVNAPARGVKLHPSEPVSGLSASTAYEFRLCLVETSGRVDGRQPYRCASALPFRTGGSAVAPKNTQLPKISGSALVGRVLTATSGAWAGTTPVTFAYQWEDCDTAGAACAAIPGATRATYTVAARDRLHTLRVRVAATNPGGAIGASSAPTAVVPGLHVAGNQLLDEAGRVVRLHGVNRAGTEYACVQGWGIFDGPADAASVAAMAAWHVNAVRIPINEDCWLGINGVNATLGGATYRAAVEAYVALLHRYGMYPELSLMWGAPGANPATYQSGAPDADHSPALWASLAATFKDDPDVMLAPWGETVVDADCFLKGGTCEATYGPNNAAYATAGMQQAVNVMRGAGYRGVIVIPGIDYANDLSQWLSHEPSDPLKQVMAEAHVYGNNTCGTPSCFDTQYAPVAAHVPLVFGETGETYDSSECSSTRIAAIMNWADAHGVGYEAWTWDAGPSWLICESLIKDYTGIPYPTAYAAWVKAHYATFPANTGAEAGAAVAGAAAAAERGSAPAGSVAEKREAATAKAAAGAAAQAQAVTRARAQAR